MVLRFIIVHSIILNREQHKHSYVSELLLKYIIPFTLLTFSPFTLAEGLAVGTTKKSYDAPIAIVEYLHTNLLEMMQAASSRNFDEHYARLEPVIIKIFDTHIIVKIILGRYWKDLTEQQKQEFIYLFNQQAIATYVSRFNNFNGEIFKTKTVTPLKKGRVLVRTEIHSNNNEDTITLDYLMYENTGNWYIISVIADGINDLSLKRAEYATIIKKNGYENLVTSIEKKVGKMRNKKNR